MRSAHIHIRPCSGVVDLEKCNFKFAIDSYDGRGRWLSTTYTRTQHEARKEAERVRRLRAKDGDSVRDRKNIHKRKVRARGKKALDGLLGALNAKKKLRDQEAYLPPKRDAAISHNPPTIDEDQFVRNPDGSVRRRWNNGS